MSEKLSTFILWVMVLGLLLENALAADVTIRSLPAASSLTADDIFEITNDPGGTPASQKATAAQVSSYADGASGTLTNKTISGASNTISNVSLTTGVTGTLPVANGGTGQTALSALTANPTGTISTSATNGSASTFMRSDAAPALSQSIVPTWTGIHTWTLAEPRLIWNESDQAADEKLYDLDIQGKTLCLRTRTDADGTGQNIFCATRGTGTALTNMTFGYAVAGSYTFPFTGSATFSGNINAGASGTNTLAGRWAAGNSSCPANGGYLPGTNRLGFCTNTTAALELTAAQKVDAKSGYLPDAGGLKHARVTTGSVSGGATALVTITWSTAFADANYTSNCNVLDSTTSSLSLSVVHLETQSASALAVRVLNNAVGALTGTLHCIAIHD